MRKKFEVRPDRHSGPILAAALVILLGGIGTSTVTGLSGGNAWTVMSLFGGASILILFLGVVLRPKSTLASAFEWVRSKQARPDDAYTPKAVRTRQSYGDNRPPTAEEVHDLKGGPNNWVPSRNVNSRKPTRRRKEKRQE
mgnify:CR=1 FL=1